MALLQIGAYRPDVADYQSDATKNVLNVMPRGDGYGPFRNFAALSQALPAVCRGGYYALKSDGSIQIFAGTSDRLYTASNTDYSWTPVSKVATFTVTIASPGVITKTAHGFAANDPFVPTTTGALPTGMTAGTKYFVKTVLTADTFTFSATAGGAAINTTGSQSGTHSLTYLYSALSSGKQWQFTQFGNIVIAVQGNVAPQAFDLSSSTAFADLGGSPPQADYVSTVGRFVVLSGLASNPYRIHWSGLNAITTWTSGTNSSDFQDLPDGGIVRGVAGGEAGIIFQDQAIRRMSFIPGSPLVFQIERIAQDKGLFAPYSIVRAGDTIFFHSAHGFHKIVPGGIPEQIGREKVDRFFFDDLDKAQLHVFVGAYDPRATRVFWAYKSTSGVSNLYDKIIGFDFLLDRWFRISMTGEYLLGLSQPGITLESLDSISGSLDALEVSLDAFAVSTQPLIAQFNSSHELGFFTGDTLEATLETSEQRRVFTDGFEPITDAATVYGSLSFRETPQGVSTSTAEVLINSRTGRCDVRKDARYMRFKGRIPAATTWTFYAGVEPDIRPGGGY